MFNQNYHLSKIALIFLSGLMGSLSLTSTQASESLPNAPEKFTIMGTVRDFSDTHPDFERNPGETSADGTVFGYGNDQNIVTDWIGEDGKPVYKEGSYSTTTADNFNQWYNDVDDINQSIELPITLTKQSNGLYRYQNTNFFPVDGKLMGNESRSHNYHFTFELHNSFTYQGGEVFDFSGDDDVWVYINDQKVIDLGGVHSRQDASVNLDDIAEDLGLVVGETYLLDFFFAERHTTQSNFIITTNIDLLQLSYSD